MNALVADGLGGSLAAYEVAREHGVLLAAARAADSAMEAAAAEAEAALMNADLVRVAEGADRAQRSLNVFLGALFGEPVEAE